MSLAPQVTATGISGPSYADVFASLQNLYWSIYGTDADLDPDSQDGQYIAALAQAIYDAGQTMIAVYNSFSPATAVGAGLSSNVKLNGLKRLVPSNSQAVVSVGGQVGTQIVNGIIGDNLNLNTQWALPPLVTIPDEGTIDVTATCLALGSTTADIGTLTKILTPTANWQSVTNAAAATPGNPVESDATLRLRQSVSTALPALTPLESIYAAVANLDAVERLKAYENDTGIPDDNGLPGHSISLVIEGGDVGDITQAIASKKTPGTSTYGTTNQVVIDSNGVPNTINYFVLDVLEIDVVVNVKALTGFVSTTEALIQQAVAEFISTLDIGEDSYCFRIGSPAQLSGDAATNAAGMTQAQLDALAKSFRVTSITQAFHGNGQAIQDLTILFNQAAECLVANIVVNVTA